MRSPTQPAGALRCTEMHKGRKVGRPAKATIAKAGFLEEERGSVDNQAKFEHNEIGSGSHCAPLMFSTFNLNERVKPCSDVQPLANRTLALH